MSIPQRDRKFLWDMLIATQRIQEFVQGLSEADFLDSLLVQNAVERQLEILGEAARRISPDFQQRHPEIDWRNIIGLRNILAHRYDEISAKRLWRTVTDNLVDLNQTIDRLLPDLSSEESL